jgi:hypothetical protein
MLARTRRDCPLIARQFEVLNERLGQALGACNLAGCPAVADRPSGRVDLQIRPGQEILRGSALPLFQVEPGSRVVAEARSLGTSSVDID